MSMFRSMSTARPVSSIVARNTSSTAVKSGVKRRVSTGAMFSITLCLASTSHEATMTAPAAPHGTSHDSTNHSASIPIVWNIIIRNPVRTPPPRAISTK